MISSLNEPSTIVVACIIFAVLSCLLKKTDPIMLFAEWGFALRRAVWIIGKMLWDSPGEFRHRWKEERPADAARIVSLEEKYPAGPEIE